MRADGSHSHENDSNEIEKFWVLHLKTLASMLDVLENIIPQMENCKVSTQVSYIYGDTDLLYRFPSVPSPSIFFSNGYFTLFMLDSWQPILQKTRRQ